MRPQLALPALSRSSRALMTDAGAPLVVLADVVLNARNAYEACLNAAPLPTAAVTASVLAIAGDVASQRRANSPFDSKRAIAFATFGALYTGIFQYKLFALLITTFDGSHLLPILEGAVRGSSMIAPFGTMDTVTTSLLANEGALQPLIGAAERTLVNQLLIIPSLYYPLFFLVTGLAYGLSATQMLERGRELYLPLLRRNLAFWLPVQFFQFAFVEQALQLPFVCVAGLAWNFILSAVSLAADNKEREGEAPAGTSRSPLRLGGSAGRVVPSSTERKSAAAGRERSRQ